MRVAIYLRISNDPSGKAAGVRRQEDECRALANARGWDVAEVFTDNDVRATARKRPGFDALMAAIRDGRVDAVVAWKDDRLLRGGRSRWAHDFLALIRERRTSVVFVNGDAWDFSTAGGRMLVEVRLAVAGYEVEVAGERQEARWRQRKADGKLVTLGRRPFGLERRGDRMVEVRREANAIRRAARDLIAGHSLYAVTKAIGMPTPYGREWHPQNVRRMITSDHLVTWGILDEDTFKLVVARLAVQPPRGPGRPRRKYALGGLVYCGVCGEKMSAGSGSFTCQNIRCAKVGIKSDRLDQFVFEQLAGRLPDDPEPTPEPTPDQSATLRELTEVEDRITALAENLDLSEAVLAKRVGALEARRGELMELLGRSPEWTPPQFFRQWAEAGFPPLDETDRETLGELIERVTVRPAPRGRWTPTGERVEITWR